MPLDYDQPNGAKISIAMVRLPAADPAQRIGSLFLNPGGPGGSGVDFAVGAGQFLFTQDVRDRFDIVGFDPRGIARSAPLRCFGDDRQWEPYFTPYAFPMTSDEEDGWIAADRYLDAACDRRGGAILDHMSTANVARDMDLLREAVGDESSATTACPTARIGQTYANMFPDNFRALVIDSVLDPIAWTTGAPGDGTFRSRPGCAATSARRTPSRSSSGSATRVACLPAVERRRAMARYAALADALLAGPVVIQDPSTGRPSSTRTRSWSATPSTRSTTPSAGPTSPIPGVLEQQVRPAELGRKLASFRGTRDLVARPRELRARRVATSRSAGFPKYPNAIEGFPGVACADSDNPDNYQAWVDAGAAADAAHGYFGRIWTWFSSICAEWPGTDADRYVGPFNTATDEPVLVVGAHDGIPATRYEGAVRSPTTCSRTRHC